MPSHRVHRTCAELIGILGDVANFVDRLIDLGKCDTHDVGVRHSAVDLGEIKMPIVGGAEVLVGCLAMRGRLDEVHLRAAALHHLLDCVDGKIKKYGTAVAGDAFDVERILARCLSEVADRLRDVDMYVLPADRVAARKAAEMLIKPLYEIYNNHKDVLRRCVTLIAEENVSKGVEPLGVYQYFNPLKELLVLCGEKYQWVKPSDYSRLYRLAQKLARKKADVFAVVEEIRRSGACRNHDLFFAVIEKAAT
jgi:hypothetical protein